MVIANKKGLLFVEHYSRRQLPRSRLLQLSLSFYVIEEKPDNLIDNKVYNSDKLDEDLCGQRIEVITPRKQNKVKPKIQVIDAYDEISA